MRSTKTKARTRAATKKIKPDVLYTAPEGAAIRPLDVAAHIREEDQRAPGFAAAVEAEIARLELADRVRDLRKARRLTQARLAKRMGVTQGAVAQMESRDTTLEIRTLAKLAVALGCRLHIDLREAQKQK